MDKIDKRGNLQRQQRRLGSKEKEKRKERVQRQLSIKRQKTKALTYQNHVESEPDDSDIEYDDSDISVDTDPYELCWECGIPFTDPQDCFGCDACPRYYHLPCARSTSVNTLPDNITGEELLNHFFTCGHCEE
jgi:hypothetical protein